MGLIGISCPAAFVRCWGGGLLVAAALKAHGLSSGSLPTESLLASPQLQIAAIEAEVVLGLWLLSGWAALGAWVSALGFFALLSGLSLYLALEGQASCGCLGQVAVNPWLTFALDLAAVAVLAFCRPGRENRTSTGLLRPVLKIGMISAVLVVLTAGASVLLFANPAKALAWLRGEAVTVNPAWHDAGKGTLGEQRRFQISVTNHTTHPIRLVGGTTSCSCIATKDLPLSLAAGETSTIEVAIIFVGSAGHFQRRFVLLTDDEQHPRVVARIFGKVIASGE